MYSEFRKQLMSQVLEKPIINIYYDNKKEVERIVIGEGGFKPNQIKFETTYFIIQEGPIRSVWYNYNNIIKIEVFG